MIIDANVYWLPDELFTDGVIQQKFMAQVNNGKDSKAIIEKLQDGSSKITIEKPVGQSSLDYFQNDYKLENQLVDMDKGHIDQAILKLPGCQEWMDLDLCKFFNRSVAQRVKESNGRMVALGTVPPYGTKEIISEIDYCIDELGLKGIQLTTHYADGYLDEHAYRDFFRYVAKREIPIYIHHSPVPVEYESIKDYENLRRSYGRCEDQIIAVGREVFSDLFEELPNLKLIHSMLGGGFFTYKQMLLPRDSGNGRFQTDTGSIQKRMENNIYFELSHAQPWGIDNLEIAVKSLGNRNVIYGSSYPVKSVWMTDGPAYVEQLGISVQDKTALLGGNAQRIYQL